MKSLSNARRALFEEALDLLARKFAEDEAEVGVEFPYVTEPDGSWRTLPAGRSAGYSGKAWSHGNWFCGFWVGQLLGAYPVSGEERFLDWARERMRLVAPRAEDPNTHDIGFIFYSSAMPTHRIAGEALLSILMPGRSRPTPAGPPIVTATDGGRADRHTKSAYSNST